MKKQKSKLVLSLIAALPGVAFLILLTGCQTTPPWNLELKAKTAAPVRVDVVGINVIDLPHWQAVTVDAYWTNGAMAMRKNADRLTFQLVSDKFDVEEATVPHGKEGLSGVGHDTLTVTRTNAVWNKWKTRNAGYLVVIGDFPGSSPGTPDLRKLIVPLTSKHWDAERGTLQIEIQESQVYVVTRPSAKAPKIAAKLGL